MKNPAAKDDIINLVLNHEFLDAYFGAAFWTSNDESRDDGGDPMGENYDLDDFDDATLREMVDEAVTWRAHVDDILEDLEDADYSYTEEQLGYDFWLTRNGHGAGFWDGDWPEPWAAKLTKAAEKAGEVHIYVGDDGLVYWFEG